MVKREAPSAARPELSGNTALFPLNERPYGLRCKAFQTENDPGYEKHGEEEESGFYRQKAFPLLPRKRSEYSAGEGIRAEGCTIPVFSPAGRRWPERLYPRFRSISSSREKRAGERMGGLGGRETPLAPAATEGGRRPCPLRRRKLRASTAEMRGFPSPQ